MSKPQIKISEKFQSKSEKERRENVQSKMKKYVISQVKNKQK